MGSRPGERRGGRSAGTPNRKTLVEVRQLTAQGILPLAFLLTTMRDEGESPERRMAAAVAAAPYCHAKLSAVEHTGADGGPVKYEVTLTFD